MAGRSRKPIDAAYLERAALHYLERYSSSAANLRRVLSRKVRRRSELSETPVPDEAADWIEGVVGKLQRLRLLDDKAFAESRVRSLYRAGKSLSRIRQTLAAKGVGKEQADAALANLQAEAAKPVSDFPAAIAYARKRRLGPFRADPEERRDMWQRDMGAMARRGFAADVVRRILEAGCTSDLDEFLEDVT